MNSEQIISLIAVCVSALSLLSNIFLIVYKSNKSQSFEKEKIKLEIYSTFITYCEKKISGTASTEDEFELAKFHAKLCLTTDHELNDNTDNLYKAMFDKDCYEESIALLSKETQLMWLRLKEFNCKNHGFHWK